MKETINVALPKGRLGRKVYQMFADAGFECPELLEESRKLIFENEEKGIRYFWVKPSDVAIYVERGAADVGVVGKDILLESKPDVYELLDLKCGKCRMMVAAPKDWRDDTGHTLRVATKFSGNRPGSSTGGKKQRYRYHQAERIHRDCADSGAVRCDCGYCGDREHPSGQQPGDSGDHRGHQRPVYFQ